MSNMSDAFGPGFTDEIRSQVENALTARLTRWAVGTWYGQGLLITSYVLGTFTLASLARTHEDPAMAIAALFLLIAVFGFAWLAAAIMQEVADSIMAFHASFMFAVAAQLSNSDGSDSRKVFGDAALSWGRGVRDAVGARGADPWGVVVSLLWRALVAVIPPAAGYWVAMF